MRTEFAESIFVHLREGETTVARESATAHTFRQIDIVGTQFSQCYQVVGNSHLTCGAGDVKRDAPVDGMEVETVFQVSHDKLGRLVKFETLHHFLHAVEAWALRTEYGITSFLARFPQCFFQFATLAVGDIEHALALPDLSTAHPVHILREDDLVASLVEQTAYLVDKRQFHGRTLGESHRLVDATGEVDHFQVFRLCLSHV